MRPRTVVCLISLLLLASVSMPGSRLRASDDACASARAFATAGGPFAVYLKQEHRLCFLQAGEVVWSARAAHGRNAGKKHFDGDGRTPEGSYKLLPARKSKLFGTFLPIQYPNADDLRYARLHRKPAGGSVGIHGPQRWYAFLGSWQALVDHSDGCIVLDRDAITEMARLVEVPTQIEIVP